MVYDDKFEQKFDVGIVGWWYYYNYGSILTYLALCKALESKGYSVLMIRKIMDGKSGLENQLPEKAINRYCTISKFYDENTIKKLNNVCDSFISGSDQMWNPSCEKDAGKQYYLDFVDDNHKKISYASSLGNAEDANDEFKEKYRKYVKRFYAVSVREGYSIAPFNAIYGILPKQVCDPVFLCDKNVYLDILQNSKKRIDKEYLLCFILDPTEEKKELIKRVSLKLKLEVICLVDLTDARKKAEKFKEYENYPYADIEEFLYLFKNAKFIITDSYHGTCFSIIFEKKFLSISNFKRGEKRVKELLKLYGIEDRIIEDVVDEAIYFKEIDYSVVNKKIEIEKEKSWNWLLEKLGKPNNYSQINYQNIENLYSNDDFIRIRILITLLHNYGIKKVVLSPGGRDVPIVRMIEYNEDKFEIYRITDERSAAYFGLGLARQSNMQVACICTSGTAVCNYLPAVTEAYYTGIPVIYITADRQQIYLNMGEDQTIPQNNIFKEVTKKEITIPEGHGFKVTHQAIRDISDCILETVHNGYGPVHINISVDNITIGDKMPKKAWDLLPFIYPHILRVKYEDRDSLIRWVNDLKKSQRIMIVYGQNHSLTNNEIEIIQEFVSKYNCVILTDPISNLHIEGSLMSYNMLNQISQVEFDEILAPDILITVGGKRLMNDPLTHKVRGSKKNIRHWSVMENGEIKDFYYKLTSVLEMSQKAFFSFFTLNAGEIENNKQYYNTWYSYIKKYPCNEIKGYHGVYVLSEVLPRLPEGSLLHLGVGQVFHDCRKFHISETIDIFCNMGTNGIDGCASTFMGQCAVEKNKLCFLLIGDLAFFYDMNSIWNKELQNNIRILLINNHGTDLLRSHNLKAISSVHNTSAKGWVESVGFEYLEAHTKEEFLEKLKYFLSRDAERALFFEVFCN